MLRTYMLFAFASVAILLSHTGRAIAACVLIEDENFVVQDGDLYDCLRFTGGTLEVIGGRIKRLEVAESRSDRLVNIRGGEVGGSPVADENIVLYGGAVAIYGGIVRGAIYRPESPGASIDIHGLEFETFSTGTSTSVNAWLLDLNYIAVAAFRPEDGDPTAFPLNLVEHPGRVDATGDFFFDLNDLNAVRNTFGETGPADMNEDGIVDLLDLNRVRNRFGFGFPPDAAPVPEPTTLLLAAVTSIAAIGRRLKH